MELAGRQAVDQGRGQREMANQSKRPQRRLADSHSRQAREAGTRLEDDSIRRPLPRRSIASGTCLSWHSTRPLR